MFTGYNNDVVVMKNGGDTWRSRNCGVTGLLWLVGEAMGSGVSSSPSVGSMDAATGVKTYERYKPWGENRGSTTLPTRYQFTGQRREASLDGLYDYGARWYDSLAGVFLQPDSLVPDPYNPLDWNRYLYVRGNPANHTDSSGHCIDGFSTILCAMAVGAVVSVAVDAYITTQVEHKDYSWERAGVAATAGAVSGLIAAAVIVPLAAATGAATVSVLGVSAASAPTVAAVADVAMGAALSAEANIFISSAQRTANQALDGNKVSLETYKANIKENMWTDAGFGALGYGLGSSISKGINSTFPIRSPNGPIPGWNNNPVQKIIIGSGQAGGQAISNSTLLDSFFNPSHPQSDQSGYKPVSGF